MASGEYRVRAGEITDKTAMHRRMQADILPLGPMYPHTGIYVVINDIDKEIDHNE